MRARRPFFLLEVMIAVLLVAGFASLSIYSLSRSIYQQKKAMDEIEYARLMDLQRINVVAEHWNQVKELVKERKSYLPKHSLQTQIGKRTLTLDKNLLYKLTAFTHEGSPDYLLKVEEEGKLSKKIYCYEIKKDQDDRSAKTL